MALPPDSVAVPSVVEVVVSVKVTVPAGTRVEEHVQFELQGFRVLAKPFAPEDVLDKIDWAAEPEAARRNAAAQLREVCG